MPSYHSDVQVTRALEDFEVTETSTSRLTELCPNVKVVVQCVTSINPISKVIMRNTCHTVMHTQARAHTHTHARTHHSSSSSL